MTQMTRISSLAVTAALVGAPAFAAAPVGGAGSGGILTQVLFFVPLILIFYFLLIRPQSQRAKKHAAMVAAVKRGDTVVTSGGLIGKVHKVAETELTIDFGENMRGKVIKSMVIEVRGKTPPAAAND
jgi:preprotein translocase subunit YajC